MLKPFLMKTIPNYFIPCLSFWKENFHSFSNFFCFHKWHCNNPQHPAKKGQHKPTANRTIAYPAKHRNAQQK